MEKILSHPTGNSFIVLGNNTYNIDNIVQTRCYQHDALQKMIRAKQQYGIDAEKSFSYINDTIKFKIKKSCFETPGIYVLIRADNSESLISTDYNSLVEIISLQNRISDF